jgi:hypothetical protein
VWRCQHDGGSAARKVDSYLIGVTLKTAEEIRQASEKAAISELSVFPPVLT